MSSTDGSVVGFSSTRYGIHPHPPILEYYRNDLGVLYKVENYKGNLKENIGR